MKLHDEDVCQLLDLVRKKVVEDRKTRAPDPEWDIDGPFENMSGLGRADRVLDDIEYLQGLFGCNK